MVAASLAFVFASLGAVHVSWALGGRVGLTSAVPEVIFLVRAVGDVQLVGPFKRVRGTSFARWDSSHFSPLCLGIFLAALWLAFLSPGRT